MGRLKQMIIKILTRGAPRDPKRYPGIHCHCGQLTKGGKPVCVEHILEMPLALRARNGYIDPYMGARPLREICPPEDLWKLDVYKEFE